MSTARRQHHLCVCITYVLCPSLTPQQMNLVHEIEAILAATISGAKYGFKIRFPHAFLMTFLFRRDISFEQKVETIVRLTWNHVYSLAKFVGIYKVRHACCCGNRIKV